MGAAPPSSALLLQPATCGSSRVLSVERCLMLSLPAQQHAYDQSALHLCVAAIDTPHPVCPLPHLSILAWRSCSGSGRAPASTAAAAAACMAASHSRCSEVIPVGCRASEHPSTAARCMLRLCQPMPSAMPSIRLPTQCLTAGRPAEPGGSPCWGQCARRPPVCALTIIAAAGTPGKRWHEMFGFLPALWSQGQELCLLPQFV